MGPGRYHQGMKRLAFIALLLVSATAHAQRFPYQSKDFFRECAHLAHSTKNEPVGDLILDTGCARYIEGFEFGFAHGLKSPPACMADPLTVFKEADVLYRNDQAREAQPGKYLEAAIALGCGRQTGQTH